MEKKNYDKLVQVMEALKAAKIDVLEATVNEYGGMSIDLTFSRKNDGNKD